MNHNKIVSFFDRITKLCNLNRSQKFVKITILTILAGIFFFGLIFISITIFAYFGLLQESNIPSVSDNITTKLIYLISLCLITPILEEFLFRFDRRSVKNNHLYLVFFYITFNFLNIVVNNFFKFSFFEGIIITFLFLNLCIIFNYFLFKNVISNYIFGDLRRTQNIFNLIFIFSHPAFVFHDKTFILLSNSNNFLHIIVIFISFFTLLTMANFYTKIRNSNDSTRVNYCLSIYSHALYNFTIWLIVEAIKFVV